MRDETLEAEDNRNQTEQFFADEREYAANRPGSEDQQVADRCHHCGEPGFMTVDENGLHWGMYCYWNHLAATRAAQATSLAWANDRLMGVTR